MRYANDLLLTDLARRITTEAAEMNALLRDGHLHRAFLKASDLEKNAQGLQWRLNDLQLGRT